MTDMAREARRIRGHLPEHTSLDTSSEVGRLLSGNAGSDDAAFPS